MVRPDFRDFISHSFKGSSWEEHKYVKKVNGNYYYPSGYEGGRHIEDLKKESHVYNPDNDPDFSEENLSDKNRLGDTDFFGFSRPDGTTVLVEEDMKWELPKGVKITPELINRLEYFDRVVAEYRKNGVNVSGDAWDKMVKDSIDAATKSGGKAERMKTEDIEKLAKESVQNELKKKEKIAHSLFLANSLYRNILGR